MESFLSIIDQISSRSSSRRRYDWFNELIARVRFSFTSKKHPPFNNRAGVRFPLQQPRNTLLPDNWPGWIPPSILIDWFNHDAPPPPSPFPLDTCSHIARITKKIEIVERRGSADRFLARRGKRRRLRTTYQLPKARSLSLSLSFSIDVEELILTLSLGRVCGLRQRNTAVIA